MKMKINSNDDIDSFLRNECDLGHLLDYVGQCETFSGPYWLPIIDVLRFFPEFEEDVTKIRKDLKIDPQKNAERLESRVGKTGLLNGVKQVARGLKLPDLKSKKWALMDTHVRKIAKEYLPELTREVSEIRLSTFGKLPPLWHDAIERYILFNIIQPTPLIFRRPMPKTEAKVDPRTGELYVEIRLYADTNISVLKKLDWWKKTQKLLPNYINLERQDEGTMLKRFFHFVLRGRAGLPHRRIYEWLEDKGFVITDYDTDYSYASQEVTRFVELLKKSSKLHN